MRILLHCLPALIIAEVWVFRKKFSKKDKDAASEKNNVTGAYIYGKAIFLPLQFVWVTILLPTNSLEWIIPFISELVFPA